MIRQKAKFIKEILYPQLCYSSIVNPMKISLRVLNIFEIRICSANIQLHKLEPLAESYEMYKIGLHQITRLKTEQIQNKFFQYF